MLLLGLIAGLIGILHLILRVYLLIWFVYCIMSWIPGALDGAFGRFIFSLIAPIYNQARKMFPNVSNVGLSILVCILMYILSIII